MHREVASHENIVQYNTLNRHYIGVVECCLSTSVSVNRGLRILKSTRSR